MKKKLLLSSVAALTLFAAYNTAFADAGNSYSGNGKVDPETGKIELRQYQGNTVVSQHTGVVADPNAQYKPAQPATNPYDVVLDKDNKVVKPVRFGNGSHVRFHIRDIKGAPVAGVSVEALIWANQADYQNYVRPTVVPAESNAAGDVELAVARGGLVQYRIVNIPKGYVLRSVAVDPATGLKVQVNGKDSYTTVDKSLGGDLTAGTFVYSGTQDLDKDGKADMFTNASVDLVLEKTDSYNVVKDQWVQEEAGWKYYANNKAVTGWKQVDGKWYFFNAEGVSQKWWVKDNGTWYYLNGSGEMQTGWLQDNGTWYYLEASGALKVSQWFEVNGKWYYVDATGALAVNTTVDGYTVNANGEWV